MRVDENGSFYLDGLGVDGIFIAICDNLILMIKILGSHLKRLIVLKNQFGVEGILLCVMGPDVLFAG